MTTVALEQQRAAHKAAKQWYLPHVKERLEEIAKQYNITLLFAGLFGSQAKGYAGPDSDYDFYVVYHGPLIQYVKAINFDTRQFKEEDILPPQISFTLKQLHNLSIEAISITPGGMAPMGRCDVRETRIQLNFVSFDFFVQEISRCNLDFRIALDNIQLSWNALEVVTQLHHFAMVSYDPNKYKHTGYGRAAKAVEIIKCWEEVRRSEVTDGLYRLLMGWAATTSRMIPWLGLNRTLTLGELFDHYLEVMGEDPEVRQLRKIIPLIASGDWSAVFNQYAGVIAAVIDRLIPVIKEREIVNPPTYLVDRGETIKYALINKINETFVAMLLKGGK
ncbi:hypothetical protein [Ralstonia phage RP31]|uniref:Uncharacterized protein n=2 Tax=Ripduovirus RP12 TaxID=2560700 RepID=A0A1L7N0U2_9CAUD|nr:hypothetical protein FDH28_gp117 [Ralstonia phage RP12]BAW19091.1 hypothetical protein [Ralstonia phage RP12]BAW19377.1 hypothetical protein [Ralstonia phage RP31]